MEWNELQLNFIKKNKEVIERCDSDELWLRAIRVLSPFEARQIMISFALISGLEIELRVLANDQISLFIVTETGSMIKIFTRVIQVTPSDLELTKKIEGALNTMGVSPGLITKVMGTMKVKRVK